MNIRALSLIFAFVAVSCGTKQTKPAPDMNTVGTDASDDANSARDGSNGDTGIIDLPVRCATETSPWAAGTVAFSNQTEATNLTAIDAEGVRIAAADIDGDGDADLAIRRTGANGDIFGTGESADRVVWLLRNEGDGTFSDFTKESGVVDARYAGDPNIGRPAEVWAFGDVDNDGDLDVFTGFSNDGTSSEGNEIMLNDGGGTFSFGPLDTPFFARREATSFGGASWVDVDRDGQLDLWVARGAVESQPVSDNLYRQTADGFVDATAAAGLQTDPWQLPALNAGEAHTNAWSAAACDLDGDGNPELLSGSYGRTPNKLWHAVRDGEDVRFANVSVESGYASDDRTDWSDNESARCWCTLNPDDEGCGGVPDPELIRCETNADAFRWNHANDREPWRLGGNSGTTVCGDVDNDGDIDLLTTEIVHWDVGSSSDPSELLYNDGSSPPVFDRPGNQTTGLVRDHPTPTWDNGDITGALFDFDNDGRLDVLIGSTDYPGTQAHLYHQTEDGTFEKVATTDGIDLPSAHGIAVADYDLDGDLDVVIGHSRFRCSSGDHCLESGHARFFRNDFGNRNNWVRLELVGGEGSNTAAIGARVTAATSAGTQTREVGGGHGHYGMQNELPVHFGLGADCTTEVTVRWPDADLTEQTFTLQAGYAYRLEQGSTPEPAT